MQVPAPFDYERAASVDHALALLERHGPEARLVAGGHSLLPMMKLRLAQPPVLIDINDLTELEYIRLDAADALGLESSLESGAALVIGAMTRHRALLESALLREHLPIFGEAEKVIADPIVRNRGTIGGSLCQADPSEDLSAVCAAVGAQLVARSAAGERRVSWEEFHNGAYETGLAPGEILVEVRVPVRPGAGSAYEKVERRAGDWAVAAAGAIVQVEGERIVWAGIGLTAVGAAHQRAAEAAASLVGQAARPEALDAAARIAAERCQPSADQRGPVEYKRHLAGELTRRALHRAVARAKGEA
ncbi:MAG: FAD binding domain-containing protein [Acidimicrobiales bacterium]